jgi:hypothetical protein
VEVFETATLSRRFSLCNLGTDRTENIASSIIASVSAAAETCLPLGSLAMAASIHSTIPPFSHHVTILTKMELQAEKKNS